MATGIIQFYLHLYTTVISPGHGVEVLHPIPVNGEKAMPCTPTSSGNTQSSLGGDMPVS